MRGLALKQGQEKNTVIFFKVAVSKRVFQDRHMLQDAGEGTAENTEEFSEE